MNCADEKKGENGTNNFFEGKKIKILTCKQTFYGSRIFFCTLFETARHGMDRAHQRYKKRDPQGPLLWNTKSIAG